MSSAGVSWWTVTGFITACLFSRRYWAKKNSKNNTYNELGPWTNPAVVVVVVVVVVVFTLKNHPGLSIQYLFLSQSLRTNPSLDSANFRGHRLTYLEKVYQNKMDPKGQQSDKIQENKRIGNK